MRVAIGGIAHESSTFSTVPTTLEDFASGAVGGRSTDRGRDRHEAPWAASSTRRATAPSRSSRPSGRRAAGRAGDGRGDHDADRHAGRPAARGPGRRAAGWRAAGAARRDGLRAGRRWRGVHPAGGARGRAGRTCRCSSNSTCTATSRQEMVDLASVPSRTTSTRTPTPTSAATRPVYCWRGSSAMARGQPRRWSRSRCWPACSGSTPRPSRC